MADEMRQVTLENYQEVAAWCDAKVLLTPSEQPYLALTRPAPWAHEANIGDFVIKLETGQWRFRVGKRRYVNIGTAVYDTSSYDYAVYGGAA